MPLAEAVGELGGGHAAEAAVRTDGGAVRLAAARGGNRGSFSVIACGYTARM